MRRRQPTRFRRRLASHRAQIQPRISPLVWTSKKSAGAAHSRQK
jgi:hypothetical protein